MFWGLILEPGKRYTKVVDNPFHISAAVLDTTSLDKEIVRVLVEVDEVETLIANLSLKHGLLQCGLDLQFEIGSQVAFYTSGGKTPVHLSGYVVLDEEMMEGEEEEGEEEEEVESSDEEIPNLVDTISLKRKSDQVFPVLSKRSKVMEQTQGKLQAVAAQSQGEDKIDFKKLLNVEKEIAMDDEEDDVDKKEIKKAIDEEDDDDDYEEEEEEEDDDDDDDEEEEEDDDDDDEEEEEKEKPSTTPSKPQQLGSKKSENKISTPVAEKVMKIQRKSPKSDKKSATPKPETPVGKAKPQTPKSDEKAKLQNALKQKTPKKDKAVNGKTPQKDTPNKIHDKSAQGTPPSGPKSPKVVKQGGVTCEDLVVGTGLEAKRGKYVTVYYEGRLMSNKKMFDSCSGGKGFKFRLGQGEVISGWDVGVAGMKIGGKRRIVCPPNMAYGKKGALPDIPPHSTLIFIVELKNTS